MKVTITFTGNFLLALTVFSSAHPCRGGEAVKPILSWGGQDYFEKVVFHPKGKILASAGSNDKLIKLWELGNGKNLSTLAGHTNRITCLALSRDGKMLASVSQETVHVWELPSGKKLHTYQGKVPGRSFSSVKSLVFDVDNQSLYLAHSHSVIRWRFGEKTDEEIIPPPRGKYPVSWFYILEFPEHKLMAANVIQTAMGLRVELWALPSAKLRKTLKCDDLNVVCLAVSPDGKKLAGGSLQETVHLWDLPSGKQIANFKQLGQVGLLSFSPDSKTLAVSYKPDRTKRKPGAFLLMDIVSGKEIVRLANAHENGVACLAYSPDGRYLLSGARTLKIWDLDSLRNMKKR